MNSDNININIFLYQRRIMIDILAVYLHRDKHSIAYPMKVKIFSCDPTVRRQHRQVNLGLIKVIQESYLVARTCIRVEAPVTRRSPHR
jgi:hypothetical protein